MDCTNCNIPGLSEVARALLLLTAAENVQVTSHLGDDAATPRQSLGKRNDND
ncbi:hypothetical protein LF1_40370 [Rubripirellula obstinata]|uniref:Uncharacterized protein n=1 Tax=Rubripirellula obstinata TaxID=406547 RepID=A0A5B1CJX9_9BACT|nr:hypothetical protein LF1_40370 [Rubripirellula obstinata]